MSGWLLSSTLTVAGVALGLVTSCGDNTDGDGDGFYSAPELEGTYLYDCNDANKEVTSGLLFYRDKDEDGGGDRISKPCFICQNPGEDPATSATKIDSAPCEENVAYVFNKDDCDDDNPQRREGIYYYRDADLDGYGDPNPDLADYQCPVDGTDKPEDGYVRNDYDCDDTDLRTGSVVFYYLDADGDGFGNVSVEYRTCGEPPDLGYVEISEAKPADCDDTAGDANPIPKADCGGDKAGLDDDCDGVYNEEVGETWYKDGDGDGYGDPETSDDTCPPNEGWVTNNGDCDDTDAEKNPGAKNCPLF